MGKEERKLILYNMSNKGNQELLGFYVKGDLTIS